MVLCVGININASRKYTIYIVGVAESRDIKEVVVEFHKLVPIQLNKMAMLFKKLGKCHVKGVFAQLFVCF